MIAEIIRTAIDPALERLPARMDSPRARVMMLAIGMQESRFKHRRQIGGPARGYWQFERGTPTTRGGVTGVLMHSASGPILRDFCARRDMPATASMIYDQLEFDDVLAAVVARLLLWTDREALPAVGDVDEAWELYLRTWRPGKPHPNTWGMCYAQAQRAAEA